jgi:hypothetical protein
MNERSFYYIGIAFFGMINGIFNPFFVIVFQVSIYLMAEPLFGSTAAIAYFASLMLSTATVILGGIPAALYERYIGAKDDSTVTSLWIWLAGTAVLTIRQSAIFSESASDRRKKSAIFDRRRRRTGAMTFSCRFAEPA